MTAGEGREEPHPVAEPDILLDEITKAHPDARIFIRGEVGARAILAVQPKRLHLVLDGELAKEDFLGVLIDARAGNLPPDDDFSALVDITNLTSAFDWQAVAEVREIMPKGSSTTNKNAYVVRDTITAALTKIYSMLFSKTEHRAFSTTEAAMRWLGWL
jgi:hypothetical protein